ncbi:hypothetical protein QR680_000353 [Steinernema hermaphroditum]|uniref:Mediator complex subunit 28 n=1 Tax=Steinernema hermaphroditum TaxID=289476 RepID=A0AA39GU99_9BILA|nr:hypothetical protein QR680_000353 [Steinernema hermaphroditum]
MSMNHYNTGNPEVQTCLKQIEQLRASVVTMLQAFEKGSNSEVAQRLKVVDNAFCDIRHSTSLINDLDNSEYDQVQQTTDLQRQLKMKDELIRRIRNDWVTETRKDFEHVKAEYESSATARRTADSHRVERPPSPDSEEDDERPILEPQL